MSKSILNLLVLLMMVLMNNSVFSQTMIGPRVSYLSSGFIGFDESSPAMPSRFNGLQVGGYIKSPLDENLNIESTLTYNMSGVNAIPMGVNTQEEYRFHSFDATLTLSRNIKKMAIELGPVLRSLAYVEQKSVSKLNATTGWKSITLGYLLGVKYDMTRIRLGLSYQASFGDVVQVEEQLNPGSMKYNQITFSIELKAPTN